ncbi:MAG: energy-coupling factor transporter ATPase [Clostridia bacterium]|jgi:cobalt import ATP-binding protein cbiO 2|nr:energy-coupling factor transporter ATPase [Clostridia bacterium]
MCRVLIKDLSFRYRAKGDYVLNNLNLAVEEGEFVAVIGHNGSGKSTLAKLMNGLLQPTQGEVCVGDYRTGDKQSLFEIRKRVGVVFQNPDNQLVASIVEDDVAFGAENIGLPREEIGERIEFALSAVGMEEYRYSTPARMSGGQKQRIAIAGVLAVRPEVLVLDESTAMLDPRGRREVMEVVERLNRENGMSVVLITHYMDEVAKADRVIVLSDGRIAMTGSPREVFSRGEELKTYGLSLPVPAQIAQKLREKGVPANGAALTAEELSEELCELLRRD